MLKAIRLLNLNRLRHFVSLSIIGHVPRPILSLVLSLTMLLALGLPFVALAAGAWSDVTPGTSPVGNWTLADFLGEANGKGYFTMRYNDSGNRYRLYEMSPGGSLTHITPGGTWQSIGNLYEVSGKAYLTFRDAPTATQHIYESSGGAWTENTPSGTWDQGTTIGVFDGKLYAALQDQTTSARHLWQLSNGAWSDITPSDNPSGDWTFIFYFGEANGKGYFATVYTDGGNSYRLYEMSPGGSLTHITPSGTWRAIGGLYEVGGMAYLSFADASFNRHIYESSGGAWTENTPSGTWDQGTTIGVFDGKLYAALQDQSTTEYRLWQLSLPVGALSVVKQADPSDDTAFNFTGSDGLGDFTLTVSSAITKTFSNLPVGTYTITESVPADWNLTSVSCTGGSFGSVINGITVTLDEGSDVTCTFTNQKSLPIFLPIILR